MYSVLLVLHSWVRWAAVLGALAVFAGCVHGLISKRAFQPRDRALALVTMISWDVQLLLGLVLHVFVSPVTQSAFQNMGAAMKDASLRFYAVEHVTVMLVAWALVHVAWVKLKKRTEDAAAFKTVAILTGVILLILAWGVPWGSRPLFRIS